MYKQFLLPPIELEMQLLLICKLMILFIPTHQRQAPDIQKLDTVLTKIDKIKNCEADFEKNPF